MKIPVYRLPFSDADISFIKDNIEAALRSGYLTDGGPLVKQFEDNWSDFIKCKNSVAVNSCTTGLEAVLSAVGVSGKSVIVPNYTFYASPMSVINEGGRVIFSDISKDTLSITLESIKKSVRDDTVAVMIVHVGGIISHEIVQIKEYCDNNNLILIEDAACAAGSTYKGKHAGTFGHAGVFSFHHSKILTTGEGGMVCTGDDKLADKIRRIRAIGLDRSINNWEVFRQGSNYKISEITAALGLQQVKSARKIIDERRNVAEYYDTNIAWCNGVSLFKISNDVKSSYYKYIIRVDEKWKKDTIKNRLREEFEILLPPNVYDYNCHMHNFSSHELVLNSNSYFPSSEYMIDHHFCLNMYNGLAPEEVKYIVDSLNSVIENL